MPDEPLKVYYPIVLMYANSGKVSCRLERLDHGPEQYALYAASLVRHVAGAFGLPTEQVRRWMDRELDDPTVVIERRPN